MLVLVVIARRLDALGNPMGNPRIIGVGDSDVAVEHVKAAWLETRQSETWEVTDQIHVLTRMTGFVGRRTVVEGHEL